jgi:hypothetical protein
MVSVEVFISTKLRNARHDARHAAGIKTAQALLEVKVAIQERAPALHLPRILERRGEASLFEKGVRKAAAGVISLEEACKLREVGSTASIG